MLIEQRTYTVRAGQIAAYVDTYRRLGREVQVRHLGRPNGYYVSEIGPLNQIVHQWAYESLADRETRRTRLEADPAWKAYLKARDEAGLLEAQESRILRVVTFETDAKPSPNPSAGLSRSVPGESC